MYFAPPASVRSSPAMSHPWNSLTCMNYNAYFWDSLAQNARTCILFHVWLIVAQNGVCEFRDRIKRRPRRFTMRLVSRPRDFSHIDGTVALLPSNLDLADRSILIIRTLQDGDGNADVVEVFGYLPAAEFLVEPSVIPAIEGIVDIAVPARQLRLELRCLIGRFDRGNRGDRNIFHDEMRRDQCDALHAMILYAAGIDCRDRGAVGMPDQQPAAKADLPEQFRQHLERFDMHVVERTRQFYWARGAIAGARVNEHTG